MMARKTRKQFELSPDAWGEESPFGQEARNILHRTGATFEDAQQVVILRYLVHHGDVRPLMTFLMKGVTPGTAVLRALGAMFGYPSDDTHTSIPFRLDVIGSKDTKKSDGELPWRDSLLAEKVKVRFDGRGRYEAAIEEVAQMTGIDKPTIRQAYDKQSGN